MEALPILFAALEEFRQEVLDTTAQALGKVIEHIDPDALPERTRGDMVDRLLAKASDRFSEVRSKAIRNLGKMARFGVLAARQGARLARLLAQAPGEYDPENWDLAQIVRAEAEKAKLA